LSYFNANSTNKTVDNSSDNKNNGGKKKNVKHTESLIINSEYKLAELKKCV
jgi:hypothetical protein